MELLSDFAPVMSFFSRSKKLFEQMDIKDLEAAVQSVCREMVSFCLGVIKHCKRNPIGKPAESFQEIYTYFS